MTDVYELTAGIDALRETACEANREVARLTTLVAALEAALDARDAALHDMTRERDRLQAAVWAGAQIGVQFPACMTNRSGAYCLINAKEDKTMSREVRRVPADWEHPQKDKDRYPYRVGPQPMYDRPFDEDFADWLADFDRIRSGGATEFEIECYGEPVLLAWLQDEGSPPDPKYYRPDWPEETRTHIQMYETTSEGTPISPVMETPEQLARWLADNNASAFGGSTATYEQWLRLAKGGWAPSAVMRDGNLQSGVAALGDLDDGKQS